MLERGMTRRGSARSGALASVLAAAAVLILSVAPPAAAQQELGTRSFTLYLQQAFPKQTNTNKQIDLINQTFGTGFDTWDDIANVSLGAKLFWRVAPSWLVGLEADLGAGGITGSATVDTIAGPANVSFSQTYAIYADLMLATHYLPCRSCTTIEPFILGGVGLGYEQDTTRLTLANSFIYQRLFVENDGWFPVATLGIGIYAHVFHDPSWHLEGGVAYYWARLDHMVSAQGALAPAPQVRADSDTTGPNYWIGFGKSF